MKVNIVGKNITVTPGISEKIQKKLNTLAKYFIIGEDDTANVLVRTYPTKQKIEVTIPTKHAILRAEVIDDDLYSAIDKVVDKLEDQIRRQKTRLTRKNKESLAAAFIDHEIFNEYNEEEEIRKLRKAEYEAGVISAKKEAVISLAEMGVPLQQITQGVKVEEKTVHKWLNEKKNMKTTY